jgi:hypothetical protein
MAFGHNQGATATAATVLRLTGSSTMSDGAMPCSRAGSATKNENFHG